MSTVSHLLAACGQLRTSWGWLSISPSRTRRNQRALTESATQKRNQRAVEERADRKHLVNERVIVGGGQPPANLGVVEAKMSIAGVVDELAAELSLAVGVLSEVGPVRAKVGAHYTRNASSDAKFTAALDWISTRADLLNHHYHQPLIDHAHNVLTRADRLARSIAGDGPDRRRLAASCPACDRRSLYWDTSSSNHQEWHVGCDNPNCRCQGVICPCKMPDRQHGDAHLWLESSWEGFARHLEETA